MKYTISLFFFVALLFGCSRKSTTALPTQEMNIGWQTATAESLELSMAPILSFKTKVDAGDYGPVDGFFVAQKNKQVFVHTVDQDYKKISRGKSGELGCGWETCENEKDVHDYNYFHPDIHPFYRGKKVHSLQSVTKSVTATLIGIAIQRGDIKSLDEPLLSFLEDYDLSNIDPRLKKATLRHLLTMQTGIEWHEQDRPLDETNTTLQLERSEDWVQFTLDQASDAAPGEKWAYNSGGSHLMSAVIKKATGKYVDEYAREHLFRPLFITDFYWKKTPQGLPDTEGGLYLRMEDLAKIGWLHLNDGRCNGQRILPKGWAKDATSIHVKNVNQYGWGYGYQWWRLDRNGKQVWAGLGFGGQFLIILPELEMVGVINSWNVFGGQHQPSLYDFIDALIEAGE